MLGLVAFQAKIAADQQRARRGRAADERGPGRPTSASASHVAQLESPQTVDLGGRGQGHGGARRRSTYMTPSVGGRAGRRRRPTDGSPRPPPTATADAGRHLGLGRRSSHRGRAHRERPTTLDLRRAPRRRRPRAAGAAPADPSVLRRRAGPGAASSSLFVVCAGMMVAVVARVGMLQTVDSARLAAEGERQRLSNVTLTGAARRHLRPQRLRARHLGPADHAVGRSPRRGRQGRHRRRAGRRARLKPRRPSDLQQRLSSDKEFVYVARQIDDATAKEVADLKLQGRLLVQRAQALLPGRRPRQGRARRHRHRRQGHRRASRSSSTAC